MAGSGLAQRSRTTGASVSCSERWRNREERETDRVVPRLVRGGGKAHTIGGKKVDYGYCGADGSGDPVHRVHLRRSEFLDSTCISIPGRSGDCGAECAAKPNSDRSPVDDGDFFAAVAGGAVDNAQFYNRRMSFLGDPRRRVVALLAGGVLLFLALLGALQPSTCPVSGFSILKPQGDAGIYRIDRPAVSSVACVVMLL